jgi:Fe-S cluster assembly iron-binding protein IscA
MIVTTPAAVKALREQIATHEETPVRISLLFGGCGIRFFGVAPDRPRPGDTRIEKDGVTFLIESILLEEHGTITVDTDGLSFRLSGGNIHPPSACGSCAFGCVPRGKQRCDGMCRRCSLLCPIGEKKLTKRRNYSLYQRSSSVA